MTHNTDPVWILVLWLGIGCLLIYIAAHYLVALLARIDQRDRQHLADDAALFGEPTREQVEWEACVDEAIELTQDDIDAIVAWDELEFAASVMDDSDDLPGGAA